VPAVVVAVWGAFVAPRARRRLPDPARFAVEVVIFAAAAGALVALDQVVLAVVYAVVAVVTAALVRVWPEPVVPRPR
jgi:Protein of unknown function (DUF2568)